VGRLGGDAGGGGTYGCDGDVDVCSTGINVHGGVYGVDRRAVRGRGICDCGRGRVVRGVYVYGRGIRGIYSKGGHGGAWHAKLVGRQDRRGH